MKTQIFAKRFLVALGALCIVSPAFTFLRRHSSDAEIVSRAELIVVGKIKDGSIVLVPHKTKPHEAVGWEHHVELLISEVLKGHISASSMIVSIHYGLDPVVGGYFSNRFRMFNARVGRTNYPKDVVEIFDTGNSHANHFPITGDTRTNHIWLLRHVRPPIHHDSDMIGVKDPEDIQPIRRRDDLLKQLRQVSFPLERRERSLERGRFKTADVATERSVNPSDTSPRSGELPR